MRSRAMALIGGTAVGLLLGLAAAQRWSREHRANLYSERPWRRLAALGFLAGQPSVETVRVLRDYLQWERYSLLRHRARSLLRRLEAALG